MKTVVIQSYRRETVPDWISRCQKSVLDWTEARGFDYHFADDSSFALCGPEYLEKANGNIRTITNLTRLLLCKALLATYDRVVWLDMDIFIFRPEQFDLPHIDRYAFCRETIVYKTDREGFWRASMGVNNCSLVFTQDDPDLDFLIAATRHIALHRDLKTNYQVGGDLIKGLFNSLGFQTLHHIGMVSQDVVRALAENDQRVLQLQARLHQSPIFAANLCAAGHYDRAVTEAEVAKAMDGLEESRGEIVNSALKLGRLPPPQFFPGHTTYAIEAADRRGG